MKWDVASGGDGLDFDFDLRDDVDGEEDASEEGVPEVSISDADVVDAAVVLSGVSAASVVSEASAVVVFSPAGLSITSSNSFDNSSSVRPGFGLSSIGMTAGLTVKISPGSSSVFGFKT